MPKSPQLATTAPDISKWEFPVCMEPKLDGVRCLAIKDHDGKLTLLSRTMKPLDNFEELEKELAWLQPNGTVLDGEVIGYVKKKQEDGSVEEETSLKAIMLRAKATRGKATNVRIGFHMFDMLTLEEWESQECYKHYLRRRERLVKLFMVDSEPQICSVVGSYFAGDADEAQSIYNRMVAQGFEGAMIKRGDSKYTFKKNVVWQKWKPWLSVDLKVVGFLQAKTKFHPVTGEAYVNPVNGEEESFYPVPKVGAIQCRGFDEGREIEVDVSGLTHELATELWDNQDKYLGKTVEIKFQAFLKADKRETWSLQFPSFLRFREDKDE